MCLWAEFHSTVLATCLNHYPLLSPAPVIIKHKRSCDKSCDCCIARARPPLSHPSAVPVAQPSFSLSPPRSDDANELRIIKVHHTCNKQKHASPL